MPILKFQNMNIRWLLAELVVIVLGILIAFQVEEFRDDLQNRQQEEAGLRSILVDIEIGRAEYDMLIGTAEQRIEQALAYIAFLQRNPAPTKTEIENTVLELDSWLWRPTSSSFNSLRDSGELNLVTSQSVQRLLIQYFDTAEPYMLDLRERDSAFINDTRDSYFSMFSKHPAQDFRNTLQTQNELIVPVEEFLNKPELMNSLITVVSSGSQLLMMANRGKGGLVLLEETILDHLSTL